MGQYIVKIVGLNELLADAKRAGKNITPLVTSALVDSSGKVKNTAREKLTAQGTSNTGNLRRSINNWLEGPLKAVVGVGERYGLFVEQGTRPHFPPVAPLERWAQTKLGKGGLGFVIAKKIARVGTPAQPYLEPALQADLGYITRRFSDVGLKIVTMLGGK